MAKFHSPHGFEVLIAGLLQLRFETVFCILATIKLFLLAWEGYIDMQFA